MEPLQFSNDTDGFHMTVSKLNSIKSDNITYVLNRRHTMAMTLYSTRAKYLTCAKHYTQSENE